MKRANRGTLALVALALIVQTRSLPARTPAKQASASATVIVDLTSRRQTIYGFGAGMKRQTDSLHAMAEPQRSEVLRLMFADVNTRILRTYLRGTTDFSAYVDDVWVLQQAAAIAGSRIDTFYASCNTAPASMKDNGNISGGTLLKTNYANFADFLWQYLDWMKTTNGFDIAALSIFNEPSSITPHDSMNPPASQAADILGVVGPYLKGKYATQPGWKMPLMLGPDCSDAGVSAKTYLPALRANSAAAAALDVASSHYYGGAPSDWRKLNAEADRRMLWMTEWAALSGASDNIDDGIHLAARMHEVLSNGGNAYVAFQWIDETTDPTQGNGLIRIQSDSYVVPKRYHVFKQLANSIPSGSQRVRTGVSANPLLVSAYLWPDRNTFSIQVINTSANDYPNVTFRCSQVRGPVQRQRTSGTLNAANLPDAVMPAGNAFTDSIYAMTVTTYVGTMNFVPSN
jgi:O-glycosyl hydrolase